MALALDIQQTPFPGHHKTKGVRNIPAFGQIRRAGGQDRSRYSDIPLKLPAPHRVEEAIRRIVRRSDQEIPIAIVLVTLRARLPNR